MPSPGRESVQATPAQLVLRAGDIGTTVRDLDDVDRNDPLRRMVAWVAMLCGSAVPNIVAQLAGHGSPFLLPVFQTVALVLAAMIADRLPRLKPLTGFLLTIAVLRLGWYAVAPVLSAWAPIHHLSESSSWGARLFLTRLLFLNGAILMIFTFLGRGFSRRDLFLRVGTLNALAAPEPVLWYRQVIPWTRLGPQLLIVFGVALPAFLLVSLRPDFAQIAKIQQFLPWALATAALNAANEEFQFRCAPLAHLREALPLRESLWLTAIFFGIGHYFGQPSGPIGVIMATVAGWLWAKSIVETRGVGWAFGIHMVQDIVIFCFLATSTSG